MSFANFSGRNDCPPSLNILTLNAMCAGDTVIVPLQCEYYALEGLAQLMQTVKLVSERLNPDLLIEGIVFTMYDSRTILSQNVVEEVTGHFPDKVYETKIPRNVRLSEAPSHGLPVILYDADSTGAKNHLALANEIINKNK